MHTISSGVRGLTLMFQIGYDRLLVLFALCVSLVIAAAFSAHLLATTMPVVDGIY